MSLLRLFGASYDIRKTAINLHNFSSNNEFCVLAKKVKIPRIDECQGAIYLENGLYSFVNFMPA